MDRIAKVVSVAVVFSALGFGGFTVVKNLNVYQDNIAQVETKPENVEIQDFVGESEDNTQIETENNIDNVDVKENNLENDEEKEEEKIEISFEAATEVLKNVDNRILDLPSPVSDFKMSQEDDVDINGESCYCIRVYLPLDTTDLKMGNYAVSKDGKNVYKEVSGSYSIVTVMY